MFEKHKMEKAARDHQAALATWEHEDQVLKGLLTVVVEGGGPDGGGPSEVPLGLKHGERSVYSLSGGGLFEPHHGPGHYQGASQGFSIPIGGTGVRYRIGRSRGTFIQGDESQTVIDAGTIVVTDRRVVFMGSKRTIEWDFSKLIAIQHYQNRPWTAIQVSNRQKVTGVTYDAANEHNLRLRLEAAVALFNAESKDLEAQLRVAIDAHDAARPPEMAQPAAPGEAVVAPPPRSPPGPGHQPPRPAGAVAAPMPVAGWCPDPAGRHEYRYWDGSRWTAAVADGGLEGSDPT